MSSRVYVVRSIIITAVIIVISLIIMAKLGTRAEKPNNGGKSSTLSVLVKPAEVKNAQLNIELTGRLVARNSIELFSEVSGILKSSRFRSGMSFRKGDILMQIDDSELRASIKASKSQLLNSISQILPDIAIDYPNQLSTWKNYHASIDFNQPVPELPKVENSQLKIYLSSKNVYNTFYNIKSQELRLSKHIIRAPFSGTLSEATLRAGSLVRAGQRLGSFIQPNVFELEANASIDDLQYIKSGNKVILTSSENGKTYQGEVLRINEQIDPSTQSVTVYVGVTSSDLYQGQFLTARIAGKILENVTVIPRKLLLENNSLYIVRNDSMLQTKVVNVVYKGLDSVYIRDLDDGSLLLNQSVTGGYEGMIIKPISE